MKVLSPLFCIIALVLATSHTRLSARTAPEFGPSLTWNTEGETPSLAAMQGKTVLVLFFQDWCGICNRWSGELFKQINDNLKDEPSVVLVAIKTDGGTMAEATSYLTDRMNPENWLIALDEGGAYYQQVAGHTKLYRYMWVKPDGSIEKIEESSLNYKKPDGKDYVLGTKKTREQAKKGTENLFQDASSLDNALQPAIKKAEQGLYLNALKLAANSSAGDNELKTFRTTLLNKVTQMVTTHEEVLSAENHEDRYLAYLSLEKIAAGFGSSAPGKKANELVSGQARKPWLKKEQDALKDFQSIQRRAVRADDERSRARIKRSFGKLADEFPSTYYGRLARASAE